MGDLSTYDIVHFIPFSLEIYLRVFARLNAEFWPLHIGTFLTFVALCAAWWRGKGRVALGLLALSLGSAAAIFFGGYYLELNWAAEYVLYGFGAEVLLLLFAIYRGELEPSSRVVAGLCVAASVALVAAAPVVAVAAGWGVRNSEFFGLTPDVTSAVALAILAGGKSATKYVYMAVPAVWLVLSALTYYGLDAPFGLVLPALGLASAVGLSIASGIAES